MVTWFMILHRKKTAKRMSNLQKALVGYCNLPVIAQAEDDEIVLDSDVTNPSATHHTQEKEPIRMVPRGLFIHGNVGTGKTHLMDLFYKITPIPTQRKRRVHFHSFMQDVHQRIHHLKKQDLATLGRNYAIDTCQERNPIHRVATQLASEVSLLCFDEFQVTDICDALMLSQLFSVLFSRGTVVVATSNRPPSTLYEGGLNRSYFLPFIDLLGRHCIVHDMNANTDYRVVTTDGIESFFYVSSSDSSMEEYRRVLDQAFSFDRNTDDDNNSNNHNRLQQEEEELVEIKVAFNRTIHVRKVLHRHHSSGGGDIARFHFNDLCNTELGSSDYRAIGEQFQTIIIDDIPRLTLTDHDQARRFITLVDELYEANCALMCCAVTSPETLFIGRELPSGDDAGSGNKEGIETVVGEAFGIDVAQSNGLTVGGLASVQELSFAFRRAASRLKEMTSRHWWEKQGVMLLSS
mmetsp:Transcript_10542/g.18569  ORF Transcript_10542/g.18569 Transcript_10542/m.18569 type:complete len:463 (-) Transcript_10542:76-1464(-)